MYSALAYQSVTVRHLPPSPEKHNISNRVKNEHWRSL